MPSRRRLLVACTGTAGAMFAGCLSGPSGGTDTETTSPTTTCSATAPPAPTDAATSARSYPDRPPELTTETVRGFLTEYERAYQYNDALAANPDKIGRTNEFAVDVRSVSIENDDDQFTAEVGGQLRSDIVDSGTGTTTPETPTETPLPMGHGPFETSYVMTGRELRREAVVVECW